MGISGALYNGVSGLSANSTSMEIIGNNIANTNTYGYKTSRAVFSDALSNATPSSSGASQVGTGAMLSAVDSMFGQGTFESTTSNTDLAIKGDGFFVVRDPDLDAATAVDNYTRSGAFRIQGNKLVNPEGYIVQGYSVTDTDGVATKVTGTAEDPVDLDMLNIGKKDTDIGAVLESVTIDSKGVVYGQYANGESKALWCVAIAKFSNPAGLVKEGNSMYSESSASGKPNLGIVTNVGDSDTPEALGGTIYSSTLEMSNVDLAEEFVKMITTQRGFQASSKVITTTDELLNEVINLKR